MVFCLVLSTFDWVVLIVLLALLVVLYYIAICKNNIIPVIDKNNINQIIEIKDINWFTQESSIKHIRKYEIEKKKVINIGFNIMKQLVPYIF